MNKVKTPLTYNNFRILLFAILLLTLVLLSGCSDQNQNVSTVHGIPDTNLTTTDTEEQAVASISPEVSMSPTQDEDIKTWPISRTQAMTLILERIDIVKYTLELINDSLTIHDEVYYNFLVSENYVSYTPALIVNKETGEVSCYAMDGSISPFSDFPLYIKDEDKFSDWNGIFTRYNSTGDITATIELSQSDSHSFIFSLHNKNGFTTDTLYGVAEINNDNVAVYTLSDTFNIYFILTKDAISLSCTKKNSDENPLVVYDGIYYLDGSAPPLLSLLSEEEAIDLLSGLSKKETTLPEEISQYILVPDKLTITIKGYLCYSISAYATVSDRRMLMHTYYVALDGSKVFMFDSTITDDVVIFSAS